MYGGVLSTKYANMGSKIKPLGKMQNLVYEFWL